MLKVLSRDSHCEGWLSGCAGLAGLRHSDALQNVQRLSFRLGMTYCQLLQNGSIAVGIIKPNYTCKSVCWFNNADTWLAMLRGKLGLPVTAGIISDGLAKSKMESDAGTVGCVSRSSLAEF